MDRPGLTWLDRAVGVVAPRAALRRAMARTRLASLARGYDGAATGRRTDGWHAPGTSADAEIAVALPRLRDRARDLARNNPHARKAVAVWKNNLIGAGIMPRATSGDERLDRRVNQLWDGWAAVADADGQLDIYGLQELCAGIMVEGGEVLVRRRRRRTDDRMAVPLQLQILEGDHLDHLKNGDTGNGHVAIQGVEFDALGRRSAYWLYPQHPGNSWVSSAFGSDSKPVPAGDIAHLYRKERTQSRGIPWGSAVIRGLRDIDDYEVAEIVRKKTEACVVAIVIGAEEGQEGIAPSVTDAHGVPVEQFEPGLIAYAHGGKEIRFNTPSAQGGYADYKRAGLHSIAAGYLVPYELLTGDLSQVNFSSARVGLVEFRRLVDTIQWLCIVPMALEPIWRWFCEAAWLAGKIPVAEIPCTWNPPRFDSVNPIDDANAELIEMRSGTLTLREAIARRGRNPEEVLREHAETLRLLDELGLVFDSDVRRVSKGGNQQSAASQQPPPA